MAETVRRKHSTSQRMSSSGSSSSTTHKKKVKVKTKVPKVTIKEADDPRPLKPRESIVKLAKDLDVQFPPGFLLGTSTASAQIETAIHHDWENVQARDGFKFTRTSDHEHRRQEDIEYIAMLGNAYRFSVDWGRLQVAPKTPFKEDGKTVTIVWRTRIL